MQLVKRILKKIEITLRIVCKTLLLSPILVGMLLVNFTVDRSGLFHTEEYETRIALALIEGQNLTGYDQMIATERKVYEEMVKVLQTPYDTLAIGSSRVLQLRGDAVGGSFMNCGVSNADYRDLMNTFYLFDRANLLPKNLIISIDPGLFFDSEVMLNDYANNTLFKEFLSVALHIDTDYTPPKENPHALTKALFSPSYFQANIKYLLSGDEKIIEQPDTVQGNLLQQPANVKLGDGSVLYNEEYRVLSGEDLRKTVETDAYSLQRLDGYETLSPRLSDLFDQFVQYVQGKGVNVIFVLPPYHPRTYSFVSEFKITFPAFFEMELWSRNYAVKHGIALYGSYNPYVASGYLDTDFFDGLHAKPEAMARVFPGIQQVLADIATGQPTSPLLYGGQLVSPATATYYINQWYETDKRGELLPQPAEIINGSESYVFSWCGIDENAPPPKDGETPQPVQLARYAVSKDAGVIYRFDTKEAKWVTDPRFHG